MPVFKVTQGLNWVLYLTFGGLIWGGGGGFRSVSAPANLKITKRAVSQGLYGAFEDPDFNDIKKIRQVLYGEKGLN
jgi:hypothetical protein